jgi:hypothetical protein
LGFSVELDFGHWQFCHSLGQSGISIHEICIDPR